MRTGRPIRAAIVGLVAAVTLGMAGCLESDASMTVRYAAGPDRFNVLTVYEHFRSSGWDAEKKGVAPADAQSVVKLWAARDRIIPVEPSIFGTPAYVELSADHRTLANPAEDPREVKVAWEKIEITPGRMFRDAGGALGYYHEVGIPGNVVDQWLRLASLRLAKNADLIKAMADERARRDAGGRRGPWKELAARAREDLAAALQRLDGKGKGGAAADKFWTDLLTCLEDESLAAVRAAVEKGELEITRKGQTITLRLPLSKSDAAEAAAMLAETGKALAHFARQKQADDGPETTMVRRLYERAAGTIAYQSGPTGLTLSADAAAALSAISTSLGEARGAAYQKDPAKVAAARRMAESVGPKVAVSEGVSVEKVEAEFRARAGK